MSAAPFSVYRHYRGGLYTVVGVAIDSTNSRAHKRTVVYTSHLYGGLHVRDEEEFNEVVEWDDGIKRPRFTLLSEWTRKR